MMNEIEHLMAVLAEEGGEVAKECCKTLRFGIDDHVTLDPAGPPATTGPTNRGKLIAELNDLLGVAQMLVARGVLPADWQNAERQRRKIERVTAYMDYARRVGALEPVKPQAPAGLRVFECDECHCCSEAFTEEQAREKLTEWTNSDSFRRTRPGFDCTHQAIRDTGRVIRR